MIILISDDSQAQKTLTELNKTGGGEVVHCRNREEALKTLGGIVSELTPGQGLTEKLDSLESALVNQAMERTHHNQVRAAQFLQITRGALQYKLKKYGYLKPGTAPAQAAEEMSQEEAA